ncbi:MAG: TolC family protein, partial [Verrucomicrobiota bacterium]|nr:TolC family protein [Verrucomicrobiota bacterium]
MCKRFFLVLCAAPLFAELPLRNLSLADAEEIALEYNKSFLIAQESTFQAAERESQAVSRWLPALAYRAEFRDIDKKELFFDVFSDIFTFSHQGYSSIFQLSQPIFSTDLLFGLKSSQFEA